MNNLLTVEYPAALPDSLHMSRTELSTRRDWPWASSYSRPVS